MQLDMESRSKMIAPVVGRLLIPQEVHRKDGAGNTALHIFVACGAYQQVFSFSFSCSLLLFSLLLFFSLLFLF